MFREPGDSRAKWLVAVGSRQIAQGTAGLSRRESRGKYERIFIMGKQRYGRSFAYCQSCGAYRYHDRLSSNQCICGKTWPKEEIARAKAVQAKVTAATTKSSAWPTLTAATSQTLGRSRKVSIQPEPELIEVAESSPKEIFAQWKLQGIVPADLPEPVWTEIKAVEAPNPVTPLTAKQRMHKAQKAFNAACNESTRKLQAMDKTRRRIEKLETDLQALRLQHVEEVKAYEAQTNAVTTAHETFEAARVEAASEEAKTAAECVPKSKPEVEGNDDDDDDDAESGRKRRKKTEVAPEEAAFWDGVKAKFMASVDPSGPNAYGALANEWGLEVMQGLHALLAKKKLTAEAKAVDPSKDTEMAEAPASSAADAGSGAAAASAATDGPKPAVPLFNQVEGTGMEGAVLVGAVLSEEAARDQRDAALAGLQGAHGSGPPKSSECAFRPY